MGKKQHPLASEMNQVIASVRLFLESRLRNETLGVLNEIIREMRILLQEVISNRFLPLPLENARAFRLALNDQLCGTVTELDRQCLPEDREYHQYCVREILTCFEWAERIKEEIPDDEVLLKVLAVDIPILRPFNYGLRRGRAILFKR